MGVALTSVESMVLSTRPLGLWRLGGWAPWDKTGKELIKIKFIVNSKWELGPEWNQPSSIPNLSFLESTPQQHLSRGKCPAGSGRPVKGRNQGKIVNFLLFQELSNLETVGERTRTNGIDHRNREGDHSVESSSEQQKEPGNKTWKGRKWEENARRERGTKNDRGKGQYLFWLHSSLGGREYQDKVKVKLALYLIRKASVLCFSFSL